MACVYQSPYPSCVHPDAVDAEVLQTKTAKSLQKQSMPSVLPTPRPEAVIYSMNWAKNGPTHAVSAAQRRPTLRPMPRRSGNPDTVKKVRLVLACGVLADSKDCVSQCARQSRLHQILLAPSKNSSNSNHTLSSLLRRQTIAIHNISGLLYVR